MAQTAHQDTTLSVFRLDPMDNTPFADGGHLSDIGVELVSSPKEADCIVARRKHLFTLESVRPGKTHLLWTHEPFFDTTPTFIEYLFVHTLQRELPLHVFNAHSGLIYTDNFYYGPMGKPLPLITEPSELNVAYSDKLITFAASFKVSDAEIAGLSISLYEQRQRLALDLHSARRLRLIGRGWPEGVSEGDSRFVKSSLDAKYSFFAQSNFALAFENCVSDNYVTEKIWHAIQGGCLPIYHANETIYQTFPPESFVDGSKYKTPSQLIDLIDKMTIDDYIRRVNVCREVYNYSLARRFRNASRRRAVNKVKRFLDSVRSTALKIA